MFNMQKNMYLIFKLNLYSVKGNCQSMHYKFRRGRSGSRWQAPSNTVTKGSKKTSTTGNSHSSKQHQGSGMSGQEGEASATDSTSDAGAGRTDDSQGASGELIM